MRFLILGPLAVESDGPAIGPLDAPTVRKLLLLLLLHHDEVLVPERIGEALWPGREFSRQSSALRYHLWKLRSALEPSRQRRAEGTVIVRSGPGYVLRLGGHSLDSEVFVEKLQDARASANDRPLESLRTVAAALNMWRGSALGDAQYDEFAQAETRKLRSLRQDAQILMMDLLIATGQSGIAAGELEALTARHPLSERYWVQLMTALRNEGRVGEALAVFDRAVSVLEREFSVAPTHALVDIRAQIVQQR